MASALQNALKRRKELERELAEINRFIHLHDLLSRPRQPTPLRDATPVIRESTGVSAGVGFAAGVGKSRGRPAEFAEVMALIIGETGRPMSRTELVDAVEKRGIEVPSEDKARYLGTILWRNRERFVNVPGSGYILEDMMHPDDIEEQRRLAEMMGADDDVATDENA
jgi:hypothetical protein